MENEEMIKLDEVVLAAKLQMILERDPKFNQHELKHKLFLAARTLKKWHPSIRVSLEFMSFALGIEIEKINEWYMDAEIDDYPETMIAKRIIWKRTFIPSGFREALVQKKPESEYSIDEIFDIITENPKDVSDDFILIAKTITSAYDQLVSLTQNYDVTITVFDEARKHRIESIRSFINQAR